MLYLIVGRLPKLSQHAEKCAIGTPKLELMGEGMKFQKGLAL